MSFNSIIISTSNDTQGSANVACDKIVLLLCGLPGAGKSTLARQFVQAASSVVALIEYDELQDSLLLATINNNNNQQQHDSHQEEEIDEQNHVLQAWRTSRTTALQTLAERLDDPTTTLILLDDNFQLASMRKQIFQVCQSHCNAENCIASNSTKSHGHGGARTIRFGLIWMDTPVRVCLERNRQRPLQRRVPDVVIQTMQHKFEPPGEKPFLWEQSFLRLDGTASLSTHLEQLLRYCTSSSGEQLTLVPTRIDPAVEEARLAMARQETRASTAHQLDQYLRCCVQVVAEHHKQCAGAANQCRKQLLADWKKHCHDDRVMMDSLEQAFLDQMRKMTFSNNHQVDWEAFQPILHRDLLIKQADMNGIVDFSR